ncbi:MAG TPA: tetratricopeptide repeat protein, partial [Flavobacterium sp.]|nr:tetratricopeptide repeat protein [Flavobacterium sp.]
QLEVLKGATSELIANDAIDLSVFIIDNLGLDTTILPMLMFAKADLLVYQKKYDESLSKLDSLSKYYPWHSLADDILYAKARIAFDKREYQQAAAYLTTIVESYADDILGDNSKFFLAELNEQYLANKEAAMKLYEDIIINHSGSVYVVEARKRYRKLRGDHIN